MAKQKPTFTQDYIRYWHPRKGGWYHARLIKLGRKWAAVEPLGLYVGRRRQRIPVANVEQAVL